MFKIFVCGVGLLLAACTSFWSSNRFFENEVQQWIGRSESQLYQAWGAPNQTYDVTAQEKVLTYVRRSDHGSRSPYGDDVYYDGIGESRWWNRIFGPPASEQPQVYYCRVSFIVRGGYVVNYQFNGDDCVSNI